MRCRSAASRSSQRSAQPAEQREHRAGRLMRGAAARQRFSHRRAFLVTVGTGWALYGSLGIIGHPRYGAAHGLAGITRCIPAQAADARLP
ncbi:hypothetical protein ACLMNJ_24160 [Streptomyces seoulensis]